jgi:hypothetical protein
VIPRSVTQPSSCTSLFVLRGDEVAHSQVCFIGPSLTLHGRDRVMWHPRPRKGLNALGGKKRRPGQTRSDQKGEKAYLFPRGS